VPRPAVGLAYNFIGHTRYLEKTRTKMEQLLGQGAIVRRDIEQVYEGLYIEAFTSFEQFIEDLFVGILVGRLQAPSQSIVPRISCGCDRVAREVVFGGENYVDWLPYERRTEKRAEAFFRNGLPFKSLQSADKQQLEEFGYIRNAIAHKSAYSQQQFEKKVIGALPLAPRDRTPAGYLRSIFRMAPAQTRYENIISQMGSIAVKLCA